jgi:hypothetical protein
MSWSCDSDKQQLPPSRVPAKTGLLAFFSSTTAVVATCAEREERERGGGEERGREGEREREKARARERERERASERERERDEL